MHPSIYFHSSSSALIYSSAEESNIFHAVCPCIHFHASSFASINSQQRRVTFPLSLFSETSNAHPSIHFHSSSSTLIYSYGVESNIFLVFCFPKHPMNPPIHPFLQLFIHQLTTEDSNTSSQFVSRNTYPLIHPPIRPSISFLHLCIH